MPATPRVGLITPCRNRRDKTTRFLECVRRQHYPALQVYLVDSNSGDGTPEMVRRLYPEVVLLRADDSKFWTGATNIGVRRALADGCEYLVTINDDSVVDPEWLSTLVAEAVRGDYDILASRLEFLNQPGLLWALGASNNWNEGRLFQLPDNNVWADECATLSSGRSTFEVETLCGNGVLFRRQVFEETGLYDERWTPHYHADSEFVLRARKRGFLPHLTMLTVVKNDVFNDGAAPKSPRQPPPVVREGDWGSLWRRFIHDGRIFYFSIRSDLYWRALTAYIWRHCPPSLLVRCVRKVAQAQWRLHFRPQWKVFRPDPVPAKASPVPVRLWPDAPGGPRTEYARGEFSMDSVDDVDRTDRSMFLEMAYLTFFGRPVDSGAHGFRQVAENPGGPDRVVDAMLRSKEAELLDLRRRSSQLAKRMLEWRMAPAGAFTRATQHVTEDMERIVMLEPNELVVAAYEAFLFRKPEETIINVQVAIAKKSPMMLLAAILASPEYGMNTRRRLSPLAASAARTILRSDARRESSAVIGEEPLESMTNAACK